MNDEPSVIAQRIGDADRDAAVTALQEHHVAGRLDREEFDTRMAAALAARTHADLAPLFVDLPGPVAPAPAVVPSAAPSPRPPAAPAPWQRYGLPALASAIWPLTILACIVFGNWYLIALPIIVSMVVGGGCSGSGRRAQLQRARLSRW